MERDDRGSFLRKNGRDEFPDMIQVRHLTKNYGNGKGIYDISFEVGKGEIFGLVGPKGAGKTTVMRAVMGFLHPGYGTIKVSGKDGIQNPEFVQRIAGYLPARGELPEEMTGMQFLRMMAKMRSMRSVEKAMRLCRHFSIQPEVRISEMSRSGRQRLKIVTAFMHDPKLLLLDEPARGLDLLMQQQFLKLLREEKEAGKTILLASPVFEVIDAACDRAGILRNGTMIAVASLSSIRDIKRSAYQITFQSEREALRFAKDEEEVREIFGNHVIVCVTGALKPLVERLADYEVAEFAAYPQRLEEILAHYYGGSYRA